MVLLESQSQVEYYNNKYMEGRNHMLKKNEDENFQLFIKHNCKLQILMNFNVDFILLICKIFSKIWERVWGI